MEVERTLLNARAMKCAVREISKAGHFEFTVKYDLLSRARKMIAHGNYMPSSRKMSYRLSFVRTWTNINVLVRIIGGEKGQGHLRNVNMTGSFQL